MSRQRRHGHRGEHRQLRATITLSPGANTITVLAKDNLNNSTQQQIIVTYNAPPVSDLTLSVGHNGNFKQGDTADAY